MNTSDLEKCQEFINTNCSFIKDKEECCKIGYTFQTMSPACVALLADIVGLAIANNLPLNLQNTVGNWLNLVSQVIVVYNAQQTYLEQGPGRCYDKNNLNVDNPDCTDDEKEMPHQKQAPQEENQSGTNYQEQLQQLQQKVEEIKGLIKEL